jgi:hypothetical protein
MRLYFFLICSLLLTCSAQAAKLVEIDKDLNTKILVDDVTSIYITYLTPLKDPGEHKFPIEVASPECGIYKMAFIKEALSVWESEILKIVKGIVKAAYASAGVPIKDSQIQINFPSYLDNTALYMPDSAAYAYLEFHLSYHKDGYQDFVITVDHLNGTSRKYTAIFSRPSMVITRDPKLERIYNNIGELISEKKYCHYGITYGHHSSDWWLTLSVYAQDTNVFIGKYDGMPGEYKNKKEIP